MKIKKNYKKASKTIFEVLNSTEDKNIASIAANELFDIYLLEGKKDEASELIRQILLTNPSFYSSDYIVANQRVDLLLKLDMKTFAIDILKNLGCTIINFKIPNIDYALHCYHIKSSCEAASNLARYDGIKYGFRGRGNNLEEIYTNTRSEGFGQEVKRRILNGNYTLLSENFTTLYQKSEDIIASIRYALYNCCSDKQFLLRGVTQ